MSLTLRRQHLWILLTTAWAIVGLAACSGDGLAKRYPLSGQVTVNGKPLPSGTINFVPESADGRAATGEIKNGTYASVTTQTPGDGILPGRYRVSVSAIEGVDLTEAKEASGPGVLDQALVANAQAKAKQLVPAKYADHTQSGLTFEAKAETNTYNVDLKEE